MQSLIVLSTLFIAAFATPVKELQRRAGGTGPYPAQYGTDPSLPDHTIYAPASPPTGALPVLVWGEGACANDGAEYATFLTEIASNGFLVLASGPPKGTGSSTDQTMKDAIAWAGKQTGNTKYGNIDGSKVAAAGHSCGGLQAYDVHSEPSVKTIGIFDSGFINNSNSIDSITQPIFYFLGGESDIAYKNGERDYTNYKGPKWLGSLNVGHGGTYFQPNGGAFAKAAVQWLKYELQGDASAKAYFEGDGPKGDGFTEVKSSGI